MANTDFAGFALVVLILVGTVIVTMAFSVLLACLWGKVDHDDKR